MAKPRKPSPTPTPQKVSVPAAVKNLPLEIPEFFLNTRLQGILIFALAVLLYANTLFNQWAQDDAIVITDNMFTQKGIAGIGDIFSKDTFFGFFKEEGKANLVSGGRYRPLTLAIFAIVYQVVGKNPMIFHLLTVLLFASTCLLLYRTLLLLLAKDRENGKAVMTAWMAALLFTAHPIHTEAVANVKGCDEIVTLLGSLGALWLTLRAFDTGKVFYYIAAAIVFFLGLLSKENATTFLAVVPLALWFFRGANFGQMARHTAPLLGAFLVFFAIRSSVLPSLFAKEPMELMNNPYLKVVDNQWVRFSFAERYGTIFYTLGKYVQLLFLPHPLTHDYYPRHVDIMNFGKPAVLLSLAVYGFLAWYAVAGLLRGKRDLLRFGILFYLITLSIVSNLFFPVGTNMSERFMFMPSIGFCLAVAALLVSLLHSGEQLKKFSLPLGIFGAAILLFALKTVTRNSAWFDDKTLFFNDVKYSEKSAKIQNACGGVCCTEGGNAEDPAKKAEWYSKAIPHLTKALEIHPTYKDAMLNRGIAYYHLKNFDAAIEDFRQVIRVAPEEKKGPKNLSIALRDGGKFYGELKGDVPKALKMLEEAYKLSQDDPEIIRLLGVANGVSGRAAEAIKWFEKLVALDPKNAFSIWDLAIAYGAAGDLAKSKELQAQALAINPKIAEERMKKQ